MALGYLWNLWSCVFCEIFLGMFLCAPEHCGGEPSHVPARVPTVSFTLPLVYAVEWSGRFCYLLFDL